MTHAFGAKTADDHWTLVGDGEGQSLDLVVVDSSDIKLANSRANAEDENGDIVASAFFGNDAGDLREVSVTYALKSGTLNIKDVFFLGEQATGKIATEFEASTSNGEWPQITLSGIFGTGAMPAAPATKTNKYELPAVTLAGIKKAQEIGFSTEEGRLTGSSISASIDVANQADGEGEPVAHGMSGGEGEVSAEFVRVDKDPPAWDLSGAAWLTEIQAPGITKGQAAWHTSSASAGFTVERADAE